MHHLLASGVHIAVIPAVTALTIRHFRHKPGNDGGDAKLEPKHPAVRFILGASNEGDFGEASKHVAPGIELYTNGLSVRSEHGGPAMARQSIESWRALAPDLRMELAREIGEKNRIAIAFRVTGTHTGDIAGLPASGGAIDVEGTAFLTLDAGKITEVWTVFDALALAVQTGAATAPAWWPGRS